MNQVYLVYGAPTTGKSEAIRRLASVDWLRSLAIIDTDDYLRNFLTFVGYSGIKSFNSVVNPRQWKETIDYVMKGFVRDYMYVPRTTLVFTNQYSLCDVFQPLAFFSRSREDILYHISKRDGQGIPVWIDLVPEIKAELHPFILDRDEYISDRLPYLIQMLFAKTWR